MYPYLRQESRSWDRNPSDEVCENCGELPDGRQQVSSALQNVGVPAPDVLQARIGLLVRPCVTDELIVRQLEAAAEAKSLFLWISLDCLRKHCSSVCQPAERSLTAQMIAINYRCVYWIRY